MQRIRMADINQVKDEVDGLKYSAYQSQVCFSCTSSALVSIHIRLPSEALAFSLFKINRAYAVFQ